MKLLSDLLWELRFRTGRALVRLGIRKPGTPQVATDTEYFHGSAGVRHVVVRMPKFHHWHFDRYSRHAFRCLTAVAEGETRSCECGDLILIRRSEAGSGVEWRHEA